MNSDLFAESFYIGEVDAGFFFLLPVPVPKPRLLKKLGKKFVDCVNNELTGWLAFFVSTV